MSATSDQPYTTLGIACEDSELRNRNTFCSLGTELLQLLIVSGHIPISNKKNRSQFSARNNAANTSTRLIYSFIFNSLFRCIQKNVRNEQSSKFCNSVTTQIDNKLPA